MPDPTVESMPDAGAELPEMAAGSTPGQDTLTPGGPTPPAGDAAAPIDQGSADPALAAMAPPPSGGPEAAETVPAPGPTPVQVVPSDYLMPTGEGVFEVAPHSLEHHRFAASLPPMRPNESRGLREAIARNGQQVPAVVFNGKLLDGRNRDNACAELGIPLRVIAYTGSEARALMYVLDANVHRRELSKSQRAAVAAILVPVLAEDVAAERIEKIRAARLAALGGEIRSSLTQSPSSTQSTVRSRDLAAQMMGVSTGYVQHALRVQRERPDLFEQLWNGTLNMPAALEQMEPPVDVRTRKHMASARARVISWLRRAPERPDFLAALTELLDRFDAENSG